jgi:hypothetical protein
MSPLHIDEGDVTVQQDDVRYYRRRAEAETSLAEKAGHPKAAAAHQQLATMYIDQASIASSTTTTFDAGSHESR